MADDKVKLYYTGSGGVNYDVARDTGGSSILEPNTHYEVSYDLALRLVLTDGWQEQYGSTELRDKAVSKLNSPLYSNDPGGEASSSNSGSAEYIRTSPDAPEPGTTEAGGESIPGDPTTPGSDATDAADAASKDPDDEEGGE